MPRRDTPDVLLAKAGEDERTLTLLAGHHEADDAAIGFHAQQAVEKSLKAVLSARDIRYAWRHDLDYLADLVEDAGAELPAPRDDIVWLTPWAAEFRYEMPHADEPLDRERAIRTVALMRTWAQRLAGE